MRGTTFPSPTDRSCHCPSASSPIVPQWPQDRRDPQEEPQKGPLEVRRGRRRAHASSRSILQEASSPRGKGEAGSEFEECEVVEELGA